MSEGSESLDWNPVPDESDANSAHGDQDSDDPAEDVHNDPDSTTEGNSPAITFEGDAISADPDFEPAAAGESEGVAGAAGPINDEGVVADAVDAVREDESDTDEPPASETPSETGGDETAAGSAVESPQDGQDDRSSAQSTSSEKTMDVPQEIAGMLYTKDEDQLNSSIDRPIDMYENQFKYFGTRSIRLYHGFLKDVLFEGMTQKEKDLLYEKLIEDKIEAKLRQLREE